MSQDHREDQLEKPAAEVDVQLPTGEPAAATVTEEDAVKRDQPQQDVLTVERLDEARNRKAIDASESSSSQRPNRFESKSSRSSMEIEKTIHRTLKDVRRRQKAELERMKNDKKPEIIIQGDYRTRGLDYCYYCGD